MKDNLSEKELVGILRGFHILGDSTSLKILFELQRYGEKNFSDLRHAIDANPATLSKKLRVLEQSELIVADRTRDRVKVYYSVDEQHHKKSIRRFIDALERLSFDL